MKRLREDPALSRALPGLFPEAMVLGTGEVAMSRLPGITYEVLVEKYGEHHAVVERARKDVARALELAGRFQKLALAALKPIRRTTRSRRRDARAHLV